jgi:hypothetical protein
MGMGTRRVRISVIAMLLAGAAYWAGPVATQPASESPRAGETESDPIKCWWRTDRSAVHIGEQFTLVLTCGVVETSRLRVAADQNRLDPMATELIPFEVVGGSRHRDIEVPPWRYFQYSYTVRLLGDEFFGREVAIPSIQIVYRVESTSGGGTRGRDQLYVMPALPMRILSLVPSSATDIWDASPETFADIDARLFRANGELTAAGIFFAFAAVLAGLAVVRMARRHATRVPTLDRPLPMWAVLRGCVRETGRLQTEVTREGWTPELTGRALAMCRIAGAVALDRPVAQTLVNVDVPGSEGQLALRKGILRPKRALISAPTTAAAIALQLDSGNLCQRDARARAVLEEIQGALRVFGAARYGRNGHLDVTALDTALDGGARAIRRLRVMKRWPRRAADALTGAAGRLRGILWAR